MAMDADIKSLDNLREAVKARLSEKRYLHTLGVEACATKLGEIFLPDKVFELRAAALLHDIAKELPVTLLRDLYQSSIFSHKKCVDAALHSFVGALLIERDFPKYATKEIISAVANHTLGSPDMTLFDEIIFISDYIEDGRTYESCISVRNTLFQELSSRTSKEEKHLALRRAIYRSLCYTLDALNNRGVKPDDTSVLTKNAYSS